MIKLNDILKSRDITLSTKVCLVKAMFFSSSHVQMWELDNKKGWVLKNWCPWTVVFEKTLESPLESKEIKPVNPKGNQSWIFIGGLMLTMKCQFFGHLMRKADSMERLWCWASFRAGGVGDDRGWDDWMASPTQWSWVLANPGKWWSTEKPGVLQSMGSQRVRYNWVTEQQHFPIEHIVSHPQVSPMVDLEWNRSEKTHLHVFGHAYKVFNKHIINPSFPITEMKYI